MNILLNIPAYNEEAMIEKTIRSVLEAKKYLQEYTEKYGQWYNVTRHRNKQVYIHDSDFLYDCVSVG